MDKNTITGLVLIFAVLLGFSVLNNSRLTKLYDKTVEKGDSLVNAGNYDQARIEYLKALKYKPNKPEAAEKLNEVNTVLFKSSAGIDADTTKTVAVRKDTPAETHQGTADPMRFGAFSQSAEGELEFIEVENEVVRVRISTLGGRIYSVTLKDYVTHDGDPLILFDGDSTRFGFKFFTADNKAVYSNDLYFIPVNSRYNYNITGGTQGDTITLRSYAGSDSFIEYNYTFEPGQYMVGLEVRLHNLEGIIAANQSSISLDWQQYMPQQEKGRQNEDNYTAIKVKHLNADIDGFRERSTKEFEEMEVPTKLKWVAFKDQFFSSVLIADDHFINGKVASTRLPLSTKYLRLFTSETGIPYHPDQEVKIGLRLYFGPNHFSSLKKYDLDLEELVFLGRNIIRGINQYVIIPVFNLLNNRISNYGLIIFILTILLKIILFPLTHKSFQSQAKMRVLKPMVDEINKKYSKPDEAVKKQQATMALYKKAGINPLGGCLPMLLQMPILFSMFRFFPTSIELRQQAFLWAKDLSTYDSILDLPFTIPMYGDHVSLFTLLMTASTIITMKINSPSSTGQEQMPGMKMMMYMMPLMFMLVMNNLSAGLTYYYFLANIITFLQNMISKRFVDENKILQKIEESSKKPVKKSAWQAKLEEAAKKRGYKPSKK